MFDSIADYSLPVFAGAVISFFMSLTGVGGAVLTIPMLNLLFNMNVTESIGTASLFIGLANIASSAAQIRRRNADFKTIGRVLAGALPVHLAISISIIYYLGAYTEDAPEFKAYLKQLVIFVVLSSVAIMLVEKRNKKRLRNQSSTNKRPILVKLGGALAGAVIGATGVGGGVLMVPLLMRTTQLGAKKIVGTSIVVTLILSLATALVYSKGSETNIRFGILMSLGAIVGIPLADYVGRKIQDESLEYVIIGLVILSALLMLIR